MRNRHRHAVEQALRWMSRRTTQVHSELKGASGTPGYMAPEMLRREVYDHRVDYFSLGCMVVEFIVGVRRRLFDVIRGGDQSQTLHESGADYADF